MTNVVTPLSAAQQRVATFSDEDRKKLQDRLKQIAAARKPLQKAIEPFQESLRALDDLAAAVEEEAGVEIIENCVSCERLLIVGDLGHACSDGPTYCEACAPTWNDLAKDYEDPEVAKAAAESEGDTLSLETIQANIAAGHGDKKHVWPL